MTPSQGDPRVQRPRRLRVSPASQGAGTLPGVDQARTPARRQRLITWTTATEWPLTIAAVVFLVAYSWEVIANLQGPARRAAELVINVTWALFALDYVIRLALSQDRWHFFTHHLLDLAVVALPLLRPLRLLRLVALVGVLQRASGGALRGRIALYTAISACLITYVGALALLDSERGAPDSTITTFPQALWWAFVTVTTVGYGDLTPVTATGRMVAVVLMIGGIAVIGVVTATLASWIVSRVADESADEQAATRRQVALLQEQIERLEQKVDALASPSPADHDSIPVPHPDTDADHDRNPDQDPGNHA